MIKDEHKIIIVSVLGGLTIWFIDAMIDSSLFSHGSFRDVLLSDLSGHELNFRAFFLISSVFFGVLISRMLTRRKLAEKLIRESEEKYKNLVELSTDIIYISDREGKQVFMNNAAFRILGYAPEEIIGRPMIQLIHPDDRKKTWEKRVEMMEKNIDIFNFENRYVTKSGRAINVLHNVRVRRNEQGEIIGTQGIARDITERKKAEEKLTLFSEAIEEAMDGVQIVDLNGSILYSNKAVEEIYGFSADELKGKHVNDMNADKEFAGTAILPSIREKGRWNGEIMVVHKSGREFPIWLSTSLVKDEKGGPIAMVGIIRDITERRRAETALRESEERLHTITDTAKDAIIMMDDQGKISFWNPAAEKIFGYTGQDALGKELHLFLGHPDLYEAYHEGFRRFQSTGGGNAIGRTVELRAVRKDGTEFSIELSLSAIRIKDRWHAAGIVRDITERKKAEAELRMHREQLVKLVGERTAELVQTNEKLRREIAEREIIEAELLKAQKLESLGVFAGGIAHDFNNLLAAIMGNISLAMLDSDPKGSVYRQLTAAEKASLRAKDLTQQLLTFSKGGAPVRTVHSIGGLMQESANLALSGSAVRYEFSLPDDLRPVNVDGGQMVQVFNNLFINAEQSMPQGGTIRVLGENVRLRKDEVQGLQEGNYVKISVADRGIGIPHEHLPNIFDPYFTTKQKGSGLGLAVSYSIIKKHDGHISVESVLGAGTTFSLYIPAFKERRAAPRARGETLLTGHERVLVMDDEEDVRTTTKDMLTRLGYEVALAEDGAQATAMYRAALKTEKPFDLVIMDLTVRGGLGGKEAVKKLLEIDPHARAIVSSGYSEDPVMADYKNYGFKGVAPKPFRMKELSRVVHAALKARQ